MDIQKILQEALSGFGIESGIVNTIEETDLYESVGKAFVNVIGKDELEKYASSLKMTEDNDGPIVE